MRVKFPTILLVECSLRRHQNRQCLTSVAKFLKRSLQQSTTYTASTSSWVCSYTNHIASRQHSTAYINIILTQMNSTQQLVLFKAHHCIFRFITICKIILEEWIFLWFKAVRPKVLYMWRILSCCNSKFHKYILVIV